MRLRVVETSGLVLAILRAFTWLVVQDVTGFTVQRPADFFQGGKTNGPGLAGLQLGQVGNRNPREFGQLIQPHLFFDQLQVQVDQYGHLPLLLDHGLEFFFHGVVLFQYQGPQVAEKSSQKGTAPLEGRQEQVQIFKKEDHLPGCRIPPIAQWH